MRTAVLADAVQTGDGWFGLALAVLNVIQTVALAGLAAWAANQRRGASAKSKRSPGPPSD